MCAWCLYRRTPPSSPGLYRKNGVQVADRDGMVVMLNDSAHAVREAVQGRLQAGRQMDTHYDHPILLLQHMIWHEGYHHGQIKLTLKLAGQPLPNKDIGPLTWRVWMNKTK